MHKTRRQKKKDPAYQVAVYQHNIATNRKFQAARKSQSERWHVLAKLEGRVAGVARRARRKANKVARKSRRANRA